MKVLSAAEMQACDRLTSERYGIPSFELMRAAATAVAAFAREHFPTARRVTVLCGRGNNGGDGLVAARLLAEAGLEVTTLLLGAPDALTGDAARAWSELTAEIEPRVQFVETAEELARHGAVFECDLLVDAVLGTGFQPPMRGLALAALDWVKRSRAPVLSVDLPSGWPADATAAECAGPVFPSDAVITFTAPKPAHVFGHLTRRWNQPVVVVPIGSPEEAMQSELHLGWTGAALEMVQAPRAAAANKGSFGHVLVVGGTFGSAGGKAGAPSMAALAAMRAGAGLVTAAVPAPALAVVAAVAPDLMMWPLEATAAGEMAAANLAPERLAALTVGMTVLALGPGMGQSAETARFAFGLLEATRMPVVLDADALNLLAADPQRIGALARERTVVLTPHPGEMARLIGATVAEVQANRLEVARSFVRRTGVTLVLKGARTLVAHPDGRVAVNTTGNPGMAKGGSGDVLAGLVAGLLAQYPHDAARAVEAAVYLHGLAADLAVRAGNEHTLVATDTVAHLSGAFRFRACGPNGYLWIQGLPAEALQAAAHREAHE